MDFKMAKTYYTYTSPDYMPGPEEPEQATLSPDYVPDPEEPEQAPPSPVYLPYVPKPVYPEYMPPDDNVFPAEEQPLPIAATPTADSPGYIPEFDPKGTIEEDDEEDPEEDPADYPADSTVVALPAVDHVPSEEVTKPSPQIPSPPLPIPSPPPDSPTHIEIPKKVGKSLAAGAARVDVAPGCLMSKELDYDITNTWDELVGASKEIAPTTLQGVNQRVTNLSTIVEQDTTIMYGMMEDAQDDRSQLRGRAIDRKRQGVIKELLAADHKRQVQLTKALRLLKGLQTQMIEYSDDRVLEAPWTRKSLLSIMGYSQLADCIDLLFCLATQYRPFVQKMAPKQTARSTPVITTPAPETTTSITNAQLQAMIDQGITAALAARDANRNGDDSHTSRTEIDKVERYVDGLPDTIHDNVMETKPKTMQDAIEFATELMNKKINTWAEWNGDRRAYEWPRPLCTKCNYHQAVLVLPNATSATDLEHFKKECPKLKNNNNRGNQVGNAKAQARVYAVGKAGANPENNVVTDLIPVELGSFDVIIGMDWLAKYHAVIICAEKIIRIPFGDEILIVRGNGSSNKHGTRLNNISYTKTQEYLTKGCHVFLENITATKDEDKSKGKRLEDLPIVQEFLEVFFPEDLPEVELFEPGFELQGSKMVEIDFFNDPRIIREQRIAAYKGYRGGGMEVMCGGYEIRCGGLGSRFDVLDGVCGVAAFMEKKEEMWPF
uniref:Reverse transcriptase domain-containing protein n=1 Tax=Tanacetum cinerariifolium TaxID=118510 RepID=A0A6L2JML5_TANCI|nr:reverse transcriptase domain-containing protein [Tanacetum cinerariifolium]